MEETKQDDCPMFYQAMRLLYGEGFHAEPDCDKLKGAILYIDFSGTFDKRRITGGPDAVAKAEAMLSPEGVTIDFGKGGNKYVAFERSASMSRNNILSFIREDLYEPLRERIMLGMTVGCVFRGVLEIYGTTNALCVVYPVAGSILLTIGLITGIVGSKKKKQKSGSFN